jgi:hypothetical protein
MEQLKPLIDLETARTLLKEALPDWEWLLARIESERGYVRFPANLFEVIKRLRIENYPLLYEKEHAAGAAIALAFMDKDQLAEWESELRSLSPAERGRQMLEVCRDLEAMVDDMDWPETEQELARAQEAFKQLPLTEQARITRFWQFFFSGFLAQFYQYLSVMVHGEKLTALVAQAKAGDHVAFAKAVQIDKRILRAMPYFSESWDRAHFQGDEAFLDIVGRRLHAPPYKGKIRHKSLWLTFAVLDACGLLDGVPHEQLLDFCEEVGVGAHRSRIDDVKNLSKRLNEYRRFQERGLVIESTP